MNDLKKKTISLVLGVAFVLAAFASPLKAGTAEARNSSSDSIDCHFDCAGHDAPDSRDESTEIRYVPPIIDPDCGCSSANAGTYTTNTNSGNVNIRAGHSTNTAIIDQIPRGAYFAVDFASAAWAHVTYGGKSGYVSMTVIKKDSSCSCSTANAGTYTTNTNGGNVRIRAGHGTNTDVIGNIPYGSSFSVSRASSTWAHVNHNGIKGYVSMTVIKKLPPTPTPTPTPTPKPTPTPMPAPTPTPAPPPDPAPSPRLGLIVNSYFDSGFSVYYGKNKDGSKQMIEEYLSFVKNKFLELFNLKVTYYVDKITSPIDAIKGTVTTDNIDSLYAGYTEMDSIRNWFLNAYPGNMFTTTAYWTGHRITADWGDNRSFSTYDSIFMLKRNIDELKYTLTHELSHQLDAPDHYCYEDKECSCDNPTCNKCHFCTNANCWKCRGWLPNLHCIMNTVYNDAQMDFHVPYCQQCLLTIQAHVDSHH